jgi:hypothetical protein
MKRTVAVILLAVSCSAQAIPSFCDMYGDIARNLYASKARGEPKQKWLDIYATDLADGDLGSNVLRFTINYVYDLAKDERDAYITTLDQCRKMVR